MKVLITGGCGFIGSNLAIFLKKKNFSVFSLDNLHRRGSKINLRKLKKNGIKNFRLDIKNLTNQKIGKYDIIIDCCAEPSVEASKKDLDRVINTNLIGTFNLLKKCIKDKSFLIFLSTSRVYSFNSIKKIINKNILKREIKLNSEINENFSTEYPRSIYGYTKLASEEFIKEFSYMYNLKYIINRFGVIAGPGQMGKVDQGFVSLWVWKHFNKQPLKYIGFGGYGNQVRDVLHVDDLNSLILTQIKKMKKIKNITVNAGGGKKNLVSLKNLTNICEKLTLNKIKIKKDSRTSIYDIPYYCSSNQKVKKIYNWKPKKNIFDIVKDTYDWQKKEYKILKRYLD